LRPDTYSMARHLAARGHAVLALDALGAGQSDHPNGYTITAQSQGMIAHEIVRQLRDGDYHGPHVTPFAHVGLGGHSSGGDLVEFAAGLYGDGDVLIPMAWHHQGKPETTPEQTAGLVAAVATDDYVTFEPDLRAFLFYSDTAEADVVARDNALAEGAPSGQFLTTGLVPGGASLAVMPLIEAPVLLLLAEKDRIFHPDFGDQELALFAGSSDKTLMVVPDAGHTFMLHPNAPSVHEAVARWLDDHGAQMPAC
jgi:alpha-beta hydrolase superfamily lysophospholipase